MEGVSIIIPVLNRIETTLECINRIREYNRYVTFEIIIVDNGSTDGTLDFFSDMSNPPFAKEGKRDLTPLDRGEETPHLQKGDEGGVFNNIVYIRNSENLGVSKALNIGAGTANYDILCFMHNDVFVYEREWIYKIRDFVVNTENAGIAGLYGAKAVRADGSFRGKTIVHAIRHHPRIRGAFERVVVVDGLMMVLCRSLFKKVDGYEESFPVHFYDKDICMKTMRNDFVNYVLNIPFEHQCGTTRQNIDNENQVRDRDQKRFIEKWEGFLPKDVSTWQDRIRYLKEIFVRYS